VVSSLCYSVALHPDHSELVVASGQLAGLAPDSKVRRLLCLTAIANERRFAPLSFGL